MRTTATLSTVLLCAACASSGSGAPVEPIDTQRSSRSFEFTYEAAIDTVPAGSKEVRLWVPVPVSTLDQRIEDVRIASSHPYEQPPIRHGNGSSLCVTSPGEPIQVAVTVRCTRYETRGGGQASGAELQLALQPDTMIPLTGKVAGVAAEMENGPSADDTARKLYWHTLDRMKYDKPEGVPWGRGDAEWACDAKVGNCTDFHSYFIGLARSKGIPARFEMGFSIPGGADEVAKVNGYHCWAWFWSDSFGWVPVDISEADKAPAKAEYFCGTLDADRVTYVGGRDLVLTPSPRKGALNFFIYPYAEIDGAEWKDVKRAFSRRNL